MSQVPGIGIPNISILEKWRCICAAVESSSES